MAAIVGYYSFAVEDVNVIIIFRLFAPIFMFLFFSSSFYGLRRFQKVWVGRKRVPVRPALVGYGTYMATDGQFNADERRQRRPCIGDRQ